MPSATHNKTKRLTSSGCVRRLFCTGSDKCAPDDDALIDSPRRIPLTKSARRAQRKLQLACLCSVLFMFAEVVGGSIAGSLAIMTDAAHLLSDVAGFCISLFAIWVATLPASNKLSFGFRRAEVIGAVVSVLLIWVLTGVLLYADVNRFIECLEPHPKEHVDGKLMFIVACVGLLVNIVLMQILGHGHSHGVGGHGHSHGSGSHGHSHSGGGHGHSHGTGSHGHSHGGHSHGQGSHHGHSHGVDSHHSHGGHHDEGHSHQGAITHESSNDNFHAHGEDNNWVGGDLEVGTSLTALKQKELDSYSPKGGEHGSPSHGHCCEHGDHNNVVDQDAEAVSSPKPKQKKRNMENLNIESAYIHALGDFIQSLGVCIAGGLIWLKPEWQIADPISTFVFSVLVLFTTVGIIRESVHILMEGTPRGIDVIEIEQGLRQCPSVVAVHDLHIWSLSAGLPSLSVHLVSDDVETALHAAQSYLLSKGITHTTIQTEKTLTLYPRDCKSYLKCGQVSPAHEV
ncbi:hypothetical protein PF010_g17627 [Phytophthora fragariae]|uniref:Cation efflux protein cytoplasmic domain-containing protein n=1 Tax=Phytophthora fragariae TaxID=53985 RepID=A0A6A3JH40_9STRA|nr:hypothetical protein PF011_g16969 [Phytophthora fragariae]KAE9093075.1 hypothetical protein PF010_g17627 [Phytophthora fragariae]